MNSFKKKKDWNWCFQNYHFFHLFLWKVWTYHIYSQIFFNFLCTFCICFFRLFMLNVFPQSGHSAHSLLWTLRKCLLRCDIANSLSQWGQGFFIFLWNSLMWRVKLLKETFLPQSGQFAFRPKWILWMWSLRIGLVWNFFSQWVHSYFLCTWAFLMCP